MLGSLRLWVILVAATLCQWVYAHGIYSWKDSHGITHYGEQAPPSGKVKTLKIREFSQPDETKPAISASSAQSAKSGLEAAKRAYPELACENARENQKLLAGSSTLLASGSAEHPADITNAKKLSPEERDAEAVKAQQQINEFCDRGKRP